VQPIITTNGPAIKGGCVTRRITGQVMVMFGRETVTVRGGYGACFCSPGTSSLGDTSVVVQIGWKVAKLSWCFRTVLVAKRSVAVGVVSEAEICHGCRNFIASSARIRVQLSFLSCLGSRNLFAKTVTSNLPLLSVLGFRCEFITLQISKHNFQMSNKKTIQEFQCLVQQS